jgi:transposase InsO family protein
VLSERGDRLLHARDHRPGAGRPLPRPGGDRRHRLRHRGPQRCARNADVGTDNGTAFTSRAFRARLAEHEITHRRDGYRDPESQAFIESWFSTLKQRCVWREEFETLDEARYKIGVYIDRYHHRPHSRLAYRTPREVAATWKDHDDQSIPAA